MTRWSWPAPLWNEGRVTLLSFIDSITVTSSLDIMERGEDRESIRWLEYERLHLDVRMFRQWSNLSRNMSILFLWLKRRTICLELYLLDEVSVNWLQNFYSTGLLVVTIDVIVVRISFAKITFLTGQLFDDFELEFFLSFTFLSSVS